MSAIGAPSVCRRVRAQVSLRLDSELSQLETRMLEVHLGRCASCSEYAADVERFTADLRSAPLEPLVRPAFVERGRRRLAHARLQGELSPQLSRSWRSGFAQLTSSEQSDTQLRRSRQSRSSRRRRSSIASLPSSRACPRAAPPRPEVLLSRSPIRPPMPRPIVCALVALLVLVLVVRRAAAPTQSRPMRSTRALSSLRSIERTTPSLARPGRSQWTSSPSG